MASDSSCIRCNIAITDTHQRAGYVKRTPTGPICPLCLSSERANVWVVPDNRVDLHRTGWMLGGMTTALAALWFLRHSDLLNIGLGMFFLVVTAFLVTRKVLQSEVL